MSEYPCPSHGCTTAPDTMKELRAHLYNAHGIGKLEADDVIIEAFGDE